MNFKGNGYDKFGNRTDRFLEKSSPHAKQKNADTTTIKFAQSTFKQTVKRTESEVHTDYGNDIHADIVSDHSVVENQPSSSESVISQRQFMSEVRHAHIEQHSEMHDMPEKKVNGMKLGEKEDPYIHFRTDKKSSKFKDKDIDKIALKKSSTEYGGGADFTSVFTDKGKVVTEVTLFKDGNRTDKGRFSDRRNRLLDQTERKVEYFSDNDNDAAISNVDDKGEVLFEHHLDKVLDRQYRYGEIHRETKKDRKHLEKELKKEKKQEEKKEEVQKQFSDVSTKFSDSQRKFEESVNGKFRERDQNTEGQSLFTEKSVNVQAGHSEPNGYREAKEYSSPANIESGYLGTPAKTELVDTEKSIDSYFQTDKPSKAHKEQQEGTAQKFENNANSSNENNATGSQNRFMTKEERLEQAKSKEKAANKAKSKEIRKAAATKSVANMLNAKKNMQNQLGDMSGQTTGDLMKDGMSGLLQTMVNSAKQVMMQLTRKAVSTVWKWLVSILSPLIVPIAFFVLLVALLGATVSGAGSALGGDAGESYDLDVNGDGFVYANLDADTINDIITALYANYSDMTETQEIVLRYALSKVGCAYDQAYHGNLTVDIFDCSSLAYRSYLQAGIDISNEGNYTAAGECYQMDVSGLSYEGNMKPGDLIFYGNSNNGRYLGVYHVAIYVGKINGVDKMVEARGTSWGVVYCDVRTNNVVRVARPY